LRQSCIDSLSSKSAVQTRRNFTSKKSFLNRQRRHLRPELRACPDRWRRFWRSDSVAHAVSRFLISGVESESHWRSINFTRASGDKLWSSFWIAARLMGGVSRSSSSLSRGSALAFKG
jgi:hypothetical protein